MVNVPRLVVAAPASGHGKTTVATGLMAALRARGLTVSGHKVGPDYIDPGYHALATGRPGRNLDPVLCGDGLVAPLFAHGAEGADIAVVEGVMGLFDGRAATAEGSTAHVAALLRAPVVLVVDASAQGRSVAALVAGFAGFDPAVPIAGVILNRVGSDRHEQILTEALAGTGVPVLGALRRDDAVAAPSRHLGLVPTAEREGPARRAVARLAALTAAVVDLDAVIAVARSAPPLPVIPWDPAAELAALASGASTASAAPPASPASPHPPASTASPHPPASTASPRPPASTVPPITAVTQTSPATCDTPAAFPSPSPVGGRPVVAVAGGAAFSFSYPEAAELLAAAGADVVTVDPLRDEALPAGTSALVLGGGFPEVHAGDLAANEPLRADVARLACGGAPVVAECAGLLYLARDLDGQPMCGVIDAHGRMTGRLTLGYRDATAAADSVLAPAGATVRGHEFHRTTVEPGSPAVPAWRYGDRSEGFVQGGVHASYLHLHWAGQPATARRLVTAARTHAQTRPSSRGCDNHANKGEWLSRPRPVRVMRG